MSRKNPIKTLHKSGFFAVLAKEHIVICLLLSGAVRWRVASI